MTGLTDMMRKRKETAVAATTAAAKKTATRIIAITTTECATAKTTAVATSSTTPTMKKHTDGNGCRKQTFSKDRRVSPHNCESGTYSDILLWKCTLTFISIHRIIKLTQRLKHKRVATTTTTTTTA